MNDSERSLPPLSNLVAGSLVALGIGLWMLVGKEYLFVAGFGAFGPGIMRELGLLGDQDEFQRAAARRAGYHAYLAGGLATALAVSVVHTTGFEPMVPVELLTWVLVVMWLTWLFSAMLAYWGGPKMTRIVLGAFGAFWLVFVIASAVGESDTIGEVAFGLLMGASIVAPFFLLAWAAGRWPRAAGVVLLLVGTGMTYVFFGENNLGTSTQLMTFTILVVPLLACGVALVPKTPDPSDEI